MGTADIGFWEKELPVIIGAPHLFWGGILAITVSLGLLIWFLFNWGYRRELAGLKKESEGIIAGLNGRIEVFEERLKCASEKLDLANQARAEIERQFKTYKEEVATNVGKAALAVTEAKVDAAIDELAAANNAVSSAIASAATISTASSMRVQLEAINPAWERPK
jgi:hypothetical protein